MELLIKKTFIHWPGSAYHGKRKDIHIRRGRIEAIGDGLRAPSARAIEGKNSYCSPGWFDLSADFCDPGTEQKETLHTGSLSAQAGGYTDVCLMPNTQPTISNKAGAIYIKQFQGPVNLHPLGSISNQLEGKNLAEMGDMLQHGALAFSDGYKPVQHAGLMLKALQYVKAFNGVLIEIPEDTSIAPYGLMHEGKASTALGLQGKPSLSEIMHVQRGIELVEYTQSKLHFTGISCKESVQLIRNAKKRKLPITCSVTPYHVLFTDDKLKSYNSVYKVNPPLRTENDRKAILKGIADGTIDAIASHHHPQHWDAKTVELAFASPGMNTLQTVWPMLLAADDSIQPEHWLHLLSIAPREILQQPLPQLAVGAMACLTIADSKKEWLYDTRRNKSLSQNSPLLNETLTGCVLAVVNQTAYYLYE